MSINQAMVKSVLSGDTLILTSTKNPHQERTFCLAFVNAPRMKREGDEVGRAFPILQKLPWLETSQATSVQYATNGG